MEENLSKNKRQLYARLGSKKVREKAGLFLVEGHKSITDLVKNCRGKFEVEAIVATEFRREEAVRLIKELAVGSDASTIRSYPSLLPASPKDMRDISSLTTAPDMIAVCRLPHRVSEEELLSSPLPAELYLMLDGVQDPGNLGTIIRTAHWFGIHRIFASHDTVDLFNPKCVQSSMGSLASVEVIYVDLLRLREANPEIPLVGLLLEGDDIFHVDLPKSAFIAMGNEGNGLSPQLRSTVTTPLTIPPYNSADHSESLNVAIATAITLAQFRKKSM